MNILGFTAALTAKTRSRFRLPRRARGRSPGERFLRAPYPQLFGAPHRPAVRRCDPKPMPRLRVPSHADRARATLRAAPRHSGQPNSRARLRRCGGGRPRRANPWPSYDSAAYTRRFLNVEARPNPGKPPPRPQVQMPPSPDAAHGNSADKRLGRYRIPTPSHRSKAADLAESRPFVASDRRCSGRHRSCSRLAARPSGRRSHIGCSSRTSFAAERQQQAQAKLRSHRETRTTRPTARSAPYVCRPNRCRPAPRRRVLRSATYRTRFAPPDDRRTHRASRQARRVSRARCDDSLATRRNWRPGHAMDHARPRLAFDMERQHRRSVVRRPAASLHWWLRLRSRRHSPMSQNRRVQMMRAYARASFRRRTRRRRVNRLPRARVRAPLNGRATRSEHPERRRRRAWEGLFDLRDVVPMQIDVTCGCVFLDVRDGCSFRDREHVRFAG